MKDKWLKDIHDRMADFEIEEPQGLWDDICTAEDAKAKTPVVILHKETRRKWMWSAAAAACLLIGWWLYPTTEQGNGVNISLPIGKVEKTTIVGKQRPSDVKIASVNADDTRNHIFAKKKKTNQENKTDASFPSSNTDSEETIVQTPVAGNCTAREVTDTATIFNAATKKDAEPQKTYKYLAQANKIESVRNPHTRDHQKRRITIGLSSSGGMGDNSRQMFHGDYVGANATIDDAEWKDSPLLGIMYLNRGAETERKVSHHAPLRTGLSVAYKLNDRWSVESGVTYALVVSDIREGSTANYIEDKQKLHYVGVPLGVSYRAASWKGLDVYLSSDVLSELCVSGKTTRNYFMGDKAQQEDVIPITSHPLQMSLGANVGVQYNMSPMLSIYVEPGCRYYFDDHSSIDHVFKERKLIFNLDIGVRFTIGK